MGIGIAVGVVALSVVAGFLHGLVFDILPELREDLKNRNDRGKLRRPSEKFVSR